MACDTVLMPGTAMHMLSDPPVEHAAGVMELREKVAQLTNVALTLPKRYSPQQRDGSQRNSLLATRAVQPMQQ